MCQQEERVAQIWYDGPYYDGLYRYPVYTTADEECKTDICGGFHREDMAQLVVRLMAAVNGWDIACPIERNAT